jgi:hypothetical protein
LNEAKELVLDIIKDYNLIDIYKYDERKTEKENLKGIINYLILKAREDMEDDDTWI